MSLYTLGLNHTTAPLDVRERVAFAPDALSDALRELTSRRTVKEAAILSTCNRTEVYFHGGAPEPVTRWLESTRNLPPATLAPYLYTLDADRAVSHDTLDRNRAGCQDRSPRPFPPRRSGSLGLALRRATGAAAGARGAARHPRVARPVGRSGVRSLGRRAGGVLA